MIEKNIRLKPHHSRDLLVGRRSDNKRPKYQPPGGGDRGMTSGGGGGNGSADRGGRAHQAAAEKAQKAANERAADRGGQAQKVAAEKAQKAARESVKERAIQTAAITTKTKAPTRHHAVDTPTQIAEQKAIDKQTKEKEDWGFQDVKAKPKVPTVPKTETTTVHGKDDQVFTMTKPKKYSPTYYQDRSKIGGETWGERAEKSARPGSGIMGTLGNIAMALIPGLLPVKYANAYRLAKLGLDIKNKKGIVGQAINQALTSNVSTSNIGDIFSGKTTTDTRDDRDVRDRGDGRQVIAEAPKADVVTESVKRFTQPQLTELQKRQSILQGYADKGALNERGQSTLMQLNQMLEQALASVAHGGRIDKPLIGRNRYI
jgi:hypothetical protein